MVRISPTAYLWIARYLAERPVGPPEEPVWLTLRGTPRPLSYWAMRQILERSNALLGSNVTMHDFRHTFCMRLAQDENMTIAEMQELMRHASIASTTRYLRPTVAELVDKLDQHWNRPRHRSPRRRKAMRQKISKFFSVGHSDGAGAHACPVAGEFVCVCQPSSRSTAFAVPDARGPSVVRKHCHLRRT